MNWSRQRWIVISSLVFLGQVAAILALHTREPLLARPAGGELSRFPTPVTNTAPSRFEGLDDPMILAGANSLGFSSLVWLVAPNSDYTPSNSIPAPRFLDFERTPTQFPRQTSPQEQTAPLPSFQFAIANRPNKSTLSIEGPLASRAPSSLPEIPIQTASDVLNNTVLQVGVMPDGFAQSVRVVGASGSRAADETALQIARKLHFSRLPINLVRRENPLEWGEIVFQWFTTEPTATNHPAGEAANLPKK